MFAASPQNDVVPCGHKHKKKGTIFIVSFFLVPVAGLSSPAIEQSTGLFSQTRCSLRSPSLEVVSSPARTLQNKKHGTPKGVPCFYGAGKRT